MTRAHAPLQVHADQPEEAARSAQFSRGIVAFHAAVFALALWSGQWALVPTVSLHCFVGNWYSYFVGSCQHCGLKGSTPDFRKNTRSITLDPLSEFLFWQMNWHCEHHMFAAVPCYNLKACHAACKDDMPVPRSLVGAWREMRTIWHAQQKDPSYEFDTPLPATAGTGGQTVALKAGLVTEDAGASIGDLAPAGLKED